MMHGGKEFVGSRTSDIGTAAEYIACADLIINGYRAFPTIHAMSYDIVMEYGTHLIRVAVKGLTTLNGPYPKSKRLCYRFALVRSGQRKAKAYAGYTKADCDLIALVAVPERAVIYVPPDANGNWKTSFHTDPPSAPPPPNYRNMWMRKQWSTYTLEAALSKLQL